MYPIYISTKSNGEFVTDIFVERWTIWRSSICSAILRNGI